MWIRCRELIYSSINPVKSPQDTSKEFQLKILIIGEPYAGKTSFITRYVHQKFSDMYRATVGVDFALKIVQWNADTVIKLQLWDIAGQERFADMTRIFYKDGVGACIVTDISNPASFEKVIAWKRDLDKKVTNPDGSSVPCILLANKCDLLNEEEMKSCDFMNDFCVKHKFISWFFTSAKDNLNIDKSMEFLLNEIMKLRSGEDGRTKVDETLVKSDVLIENNSMLKINGAIPHEKSEKSKCMC